MDQITLAISIEASFQRWMTNNPGFQIRQLSESRQRKFFFKCWQACN